MRLVNLALAAAALIIAGCGKEDPPSPEAGTDDPQATGTTGRTEDPRANRPADPLGTGPEGNVEDGAKPPTTG